MQVFLIHLTIQASIVNSDGSPKRGPVDLEINFFDDSESAGSSKNFFTYFQRLR